MDDLELSRNAIRIITAVQIRIDCLLCWDWVQGTYPEALQAHEEHLTAVHPDL